MANPIEILVFSVLDLLKGSFIAAVPIFVIILAARWLLGKIQKKTKWNWLFCAFAATYAVLWVMLLFVYFIPFLLGLNQSISVQGEIPSVFAPPSGSYLMSFLYGLFKVTIAAAVISLLLLPLELIGSFIFEWVNKRLPKAHPLLGLFITTYLASIVGVAILLFIIPEAVTGVLFFIYYG